MTNVDDEIMSQLESSISNEERNSFFLFAGAGSGKTYTLVKLLKKIREKWGTRLANENRKVAVTMGDNSFHTTVESLFKGMDSFITTKTVVGDAIHIGDTIILPLVDVSFGVAAGAFADWLDGCFAQAVKSTAAASALRATFVFIDSTPVE